MYEIVHYIFSSFWRWLGAVIMLAVVAEGIGSMFRTVVTNNKEESK